jgi:hypothetical protein
LTLKEWGRRFKELDANLPELKTPKPKLPVTDFPMALTADDHELGKMHGAYIKAIQQVIKETGIKSRID